MTRAEYLSDTRFFHNLPESIEFYDIANYRELKLEEWHDNGLWLFYKHAGGQWVTLREATVADLEKMEGNYAAQTLAGMNFVRTGKVTPMPFESLEKQEPVRACRVCGCTDLNCAECIERTGTPCWWLEYDLCSACAPSDHERGANSLHRFQRR